MKSVIAKQNGFRPDAAICRHGTIFYQHEYFMRRTFPNHREPPCRQWGGRHTLTSSTRLAPSSRISLPYFSEVGNTPNTDLNFAPRSKCKNYRYCSIQSRLSYLGFLRGIIISFRRVMFMYLFSQNIIDSLPIWTSF